ncbi:MAG: hypothetical protein HY092_00510 [Candidatus Kerfeldbacteria bacterium]|nr:hypothetical protein [Candidatus Kerfeldbacteria bacterium]
MTRFFLMLMALMLIIGTASAVPSTITIQGTLTSTSGSPLNGSHTVDFKLYDALTGGSLFWNETQSVNVTNGLYSAILGSVTPLPVSLFTGQNLWLENTVDGTTLTPRVAGTSVFYAFRAQIADSVVNGGSNLPLVTDGTNVWLPGGMFGVNRTTTPTTTLDVNGIISSSSGNLSLHDGRCGFANNGTDLMMGVTTPGLARALVDNNGTLILDYGGDFPNGVRIDGNLNVIGSKCRLVKTASYGERKLNANESAYAWFSTEGEGRLQNGRARIDLDPKWLETVTINDGNKLRAFVTFYGEHGEFYVERDLIGFTVVDPSGGNAEFSWKVEAKQKGYEHT